MLDVWFSQAFQASLLDEGCNPGEPRPHVIRQRLNLGVNGLVQGVDRPTPTTNIPKKVCTCKTKPSAPLARGFAVLGVQARCSVGQESWRHGKGGKGGKRSA